LGVATTLLLTGRTASSSSAVSPLLTEGSFDGNIIICDDDDSDDDDDYDNDYSLFLGGDGKSACFACLMESHKHSLYIHLNISNITCEWHGTSVCLVSYVRHVVLGTAICYKGIAVALFAGSLKARPLGGTTPAAVAYGELHGALVPCKRTSVWHALRMLDIMHARLVWVGHIVRESCEEVSFVNPCHWDPA
jgi:hypothetical protein